MITWAPLVVVAVGVIAGLLLARRSPRTASAAGRTDATLVYEDLIQERDETYERLRNEELDDLDRQRLETRAATILKRLDEIGEPVAKKKTPSAPRTEQAPTFGSRHPMLMGSLLGGGMVALVALLIFWAQRDARPDPTAQGQAPMAADSGAASRAVTSGADNGIDRGEPPLPPGVEAQVEQLRAQLASNPDDVQTRTELGQLLLSHGQFFAAFNEAQALLQSDPDSPTGHYISGVVRYTMGQSQPALEHLTAALESRPGFSPAAMVKGLIEIQTAERSVAIETWEAGLQAAGGSDARLEHLLDMARAGKTAQEILATPPP